MDKPYITFDLFGVKLTTMDYYTKSHLVLGLSGSFPLDQAISV